VSTKYSDQLAGTAHTPLLERQIDTDLIVDQH